MPTIRIVSLEAIEEFEKYLSSFNSSFLQDSASVKREIQNTFEVAEYLVEESYQRLQSAREYLHGLDEPDQSDWDYVEAAEEHYQECCNYRESLYEFAQSAGREIDSLEAEQTAAWASSIRFLAEVLDAARKYYSIQLGNSAFNFQIGSAAISTAPDVASHSKTSENQSVLKVGRLAELPQLPNGMAWVPVNQLDWQGVPDSITFKKASQDDLMAMMNVFERDVLPLLQSDNKIDLDMLYKLDSEDDRQGPTKSRSSAYEFLIGIHKGSDVIAVDGSGNSEGPSYTWLSGRHRAYIAKQLGWRYIPARLVGKQYEER